MEKLAIGKIRTSHGLKGYLKVVSFSGETDHFFKLDSVLLKGKNRQRTFAVEEIKTFGTTVLLKLEGIDSPEDGKKLSGWEIWVEKEFAAPLKKGEYYVSDMVGCKVLFEENVVGTVKGVTDSSADDLLEVSTEKGLFYVPFRNEFVGEVNIPDGTIVLKDNGLLS